jgi:hypothetical protein
MNELATPRVHSPFAAAFTRGARFADDRGRSIEMSVHRLGELQVPSGRLCASDPFTTSFESEKPFAYMAPAGVYPVELAIASFDNADQRVACARVRFSAENAVATRWELALLEEQAEPGADEVAGYGVDAGMGCFFDQHAQGKVDEKESEAWLRAAEKNSVDTWTWHLSELGAANVVMFSSGFGDGFYGSYWGSSAEGGLVELVTDFEVLIGSILERFELPLPLARGPLRHPVLERHDVDFRVPWLARRTVILGGKGAARVELTDGSPVTMKYVLNERRYTWSEPAQGARLRVSVMTGAKPLDVL